MSALDPHDTIAAIASPPGAARRGIVRLSGASAIPIAIAAFEPDSRTPRLASPHRPTMLRGVLRVEGLSCELPVALSLWPGHRTYTGEPMAEIHTTGAVPIVQAVLSDCIRRGARLAQQGEFTLRAFLHGRIDLTQAEAVLAVIDAVSAPQLEAALAQLAGGLQRSIDRLREHILETLAHLEATLDFVDEPDVVELSRRELSLRIADALGDATLLRSTLAARDRFDGMPRVVLVGPPNAGKSSLFNALAQGAVALVSNRPGTTRDYVTSTCDCDGLMIELVDTAGHEAATEDVARIAQNRRAEQVDRADLLLICHSPHAIATPDVAQGRSSRLELWTMCDVQPTPHGDWIATSAHTGEGLASLRRAIRAALAFGEDGASTVASTGVRCGESLERAVASLAEAGVILEDRGDETLVALELRTALDELGKIVGAVVTDDILDRIFQRFCIGK